MSTVGTPERPRSPQPRTSPPRQDTAALVLLLFGGFVLAIGWVVGVVLLWSSRTWSLRDKLIGTLIVPGGLATAFALGALMPYDMSLNEPCVGGRTPNPMMSPGAGPSIRAGAGPSMPIPPSCENDRVALPGALVFGVLLLAPLGSVSYLGWQRSRAVRADSWRGTPA